MTKLEAFERYMSEFATYRGRDMEWLMETSSHGRIFEYAWDEATKAEREACAKVAEKFEPDEKLDYVTYASTAIRARGDK